MRKFLVLGLVVLVLCAAQAQAYTWYVDKAHGGPFDGTRTNPFGDIQTGLDTLAATNAAEGYNGGHRIEVIGSSQYFYGNVSGSSFIIISNELSGAVGNPNLFITTNNDVRITVTNYNHSIRMYNVDYFTVDGFYCQQNPPYTHPRGFYMGFGKDNVIRNCVWLNGNYQSYLYSPDAGYTNLIENCVFFGNKSACITANAHSGNISLFRNCVFLNSNQAFYLTASTNEIRMLNNCFYGVPNLAIEAGSGNRYATVEAINGIPGNSGNFSSCPGFSDLANNYNFNSLYDSSPLIDAGVGGVDIGPHLNPPEVVASNLTYYVDGVGGADGNDGRSWGNAWATVTKAAAIAAAGDTVIIADGTYVSSSIALSKGGSGNTPLTFRAANRRQATLEFVSGNGFQLDQTGGVVFDGLSINGSTRCLYFNHSYGNTDLQKMGDRGPGAAGEAWGERMEGEWGRRS